MKNTEGSSYQCDWLKSGRIYKIWLVDNPQLFYKGTSFFEAEDGVLEKICLEYGDGEAVIEYIKELPDSEFPIRYSRPFYYFLTANSWGHLESEYEMFYEGGVCEICHRCFDIRTRTDQSIVLKSFPKEGDFLLVEKTRSILVSEKLAIALDLDKIANLKEVISSKKTRKKYFEVFPAQKNPIMPEVAVKEQADYLGEFQGWECSKCGNSTMHYYADTHFNKVIPFSSLVKLDNKDVFLMKGAIAVSGEKWRKVMAENKIKRVSVHQLGIAQDTDIDPNPTIEIKE